MEVKWKYTGEQNGHSEAYDLIRAILGQSSSWHKEYRKAFMTVMPQTQEEQIIMEQLF